MIVDSHHHFWRYDPAEYPWIEQDWTALRRDHLPADLGKEIAAAGVNAVVSVQARSTITETKWLLDLAADTPFIAGVVGWIPLTAPSVNRALDRLAGEKKFKGVRHALQGEPDDRYMLREDFNQGIALLHDFGLVYDILIFQKHLPHTLEFVDRHPSQIFVLDHLAKPVIETASPPEAWSKPIGELAKRGNVFCKLSGMVTEVRAPAWDSALLDPYFTHVLEAFGPSRLMFGSDWPVCLLRASYPRWVDTVRGFISRLSKDEQEQIMGLTAAKAYSL